MNMQFFKRYCGETKRRILAFLSCDTDRIITQRPLFKVAWITVVAAGGIWTVIQFADWYFARNELSDMAECYIQTAKQNFIETGNAAVSCSMAEKAISINPNDPEARYWHVYFRAMQTIDEISVVDNVLTQEDDRRIDELWGEINLLKRQFPERKEASLLEAILDLNTGHYAAAEETIKDIDVSDEDKPWAECILSSALVGQNKVDVAYEVATNAVLKYPKSKWSHFALAKVHIKRQDWADARDQLDLCLNIDGNFIDAMDRKVHCYLYGLPCRPSDARDILRKILDMQPGYAPAYAAMAHSYIQEGKSAMAIPYARKAVAQFPNFLDGYRLLIDALSAEGPNAEALELSEKVVEMDPTNPYNYFTKFMLLMDSGLFAMAKHANDCYADISVETKDDTGLNDTAWGWFLLGTKYDAGLRIIESAIADDEKLHHRDDDKLDTKAWLLFRIGKVNEALTLHAEVVNGAFGENKSKLEVYHARMLRMLGRFAEARQFLEKARMQLSEYGLLYSELAFCAIAEKKYEEADQHITKGLGLKIPVAYKCELKMARAKMAFDKGDYVLAMESQRDALRKTGNQITEVRLALLDYAAYCLKAQRKDELRSAIDKLKQIDPDEPELIKLIATAGVKEAK